ncbi:MAG TPA: class I SAM-dependent methyltransferase [Halioglobus sp.]
MHTIADNQRRWNEHRWDTQGEDWSDAWGGSTAQWHFCIYPRILQHLPAVTILEIATGYGRWTKFMVEQAKRYHGFDLLPQCAEHCLATYGSPERTFVANDGLHLTEVADQSVDFVFSMDSLVHVDWPTLKSYLAETLRVLNPGGRAFIHHSNAAAAPGFFELPELLQNWRAPDVSAEIVRGEVSRLGGGVRGQELINWGGSGDQLIDCFSTIQKMPCETTIVENPLFMRERASIRLVAGLYAPE